MAKIKIDVSKTKAEDALKGIESPKPGVYTAKIVQCKLGAKQGEPDNQRLEIIVEIQDKKYKGARLYDWISTGEASQWKMDQFLQVLGVTSKTKRKVTFETDDAVGQLVKIRVGPDTYNGEYRGKLAAYLPGGKKDDDDDDDDIEDEDDDIEEDEDIEEEDDAEEDEAESEDDEDEEESEDEDEDEEVPDDYADWEIDDLKAEVKARKIKVKPGSKKSTYVKLLEAYDEEHAEGDEDEDDEEDPF